MSLPVLAGQDPSLNLQYAAPDDTAYLVADDSVANSTVSDAQRALETKRVSAKFNQANARDIVNWLTSNGVNFVLDDDELPIKKSISMNLVNQPLGEVLQAIGTALNGRFVRRGEIYVFRPGVDPEAFFWAPGRSPRLPSPMPPIPPLTKEQRKGLLDQEGTQRFEFNREEFEKAFKDFDKKFNSEEFRKAFKDFETKFDAEAFGKQFKDLEFRMESDFPRAFGVVPDVNGTNIDALLKSLTKAQKEKQAKQGYLTPEDLTAEQRRMLSKDLKGEYTIEIRRDGQVFRLQSRKKS
ncbi:MAG: STN domain-containing protein [Fimbriimonadaceae bacterium]|nr:STN domain-containing protein [Fimbriimonadaceae bacterium]